MFTEQPHGQLGERELSRLHLRSEKPSEKAATAPEERRDNQAIIQNYHIDMEHFIYIRINF